MSYKIFANLTDLEAYLKKNPDKNYASHQPSFIMPSYQEFPESQIRKLSAQEAERYMAER